MSPDVVGDRGEGECEEFVAAPGIAAVDRVEQRGRPDLDEILVVRALAVAAIGEGLHERQVKLSQAIAGSRVAFVAVGD